MPECAKTKRSHDNPTKSQMEVINEWRLQMKGILTPQGAAVV